MEGDESFEKGGVARGAPIGFSTDMGHVSALTRGRADCWQDRADEENLSSKILNPEGFVVEMVAAASVQKA